MSKDDLLSQENPEREQVSKSMIAAGWLNYPHIEGQSSQEEERDIVDIYLAMRAVERAETASINLHDNEDNPYMLWAEIHRLRWENKGPEGFKNWRDAAIHERGLRVKAERAAAVLASSEEQKRNSQTIVTLTETPIVIDLESTADQFRIGIMKALHQAGAPICHDDGRLMSVEDRILWLGNNKEANTD